MQDIERLLMSIDHKLNVLLGHQLSEAKRSRAIMAQVKIDQAVLDADGQTLSAVAADLATLIASGNLSDADQTTLQNGLDSIKALDTLQVTPPADPPATS